MTDMTTFNSRLQLALSALGRKNGLAPNESQDPANEVLHHLHVDSAAKSFFTRQREESLTRALTLIDADKISKAIALTKKSELGQRVLLLKSQDFILNMATKRSASRFDQKKARNELIKLGVKEDVINRAFEAASTDSEPAKTFETVIDGDQ